MLKNGGNRLQVEQGIQQGKGEKTQGK